MQVLSNLLDSIAPIAQQLTHVLFELQRIAAIHPMLQGILIAGGSS